MPPLHKFRVLLAFLFRLPAILFAVLYIVRYSQALSSASPSHRPPGVAIVSPIIWQHTELCYSLISATIPCMRAFMRSFSKTAGGTYQGYGKNKMPATDYLGSSHFSGNDGPLSWKSESGNSSKGKGRAAVEKRISTAPPRSNLDLEEEEDSILPVRNAVSHNPSRHHENKGVNAYALETYAPSLSGEPSTDHSNPSTASSSSSAGASATTEYRYGNILSENPIRMKMRPERGASKTAVWHPKDQRWKGKGSSSSVGNAVEGEGGTVLEAGSSGSVIRKNVVWDVQREYAGDD